MKLVVGLGNPGPRYVGTRHNAGYRIAQELARRFSLRWLDSPYQGQLAQGRVRFPGGAPDSADEELAILLPTTFMNQSGTSVRAAVEALGAVPATDLLVAFDDLDLPTGQLRMRTAGGCGGHRGMESIAAELGTEAFPRLRFGIGRPQPGLEVINYVLSLFEDESETALSSYFERAADAIEMALGAGMVSAMERFNRAEETTDGPAD